MNSSFDHLRDEIEFEKALSLLRDVWYQEAEGFISFGTDYQLYKSLIDNITKQLPEGWDFIVDTNKFSVYYLHDEMFITASKKRNGHESIQVVPIVEA